MSLGQRIKDLREELNLTQEDLGKILNVSKPTVSRYEANTNEPNTDTLKKLAEFYDVSVDYLLGRTDMRNPYSSNSSKKKNKSLGQIISEYRSQNDLSLKDFASKSELDYKYINSLEKETASRTPLLSEICKIAKLINIHEMDLLEQIGYVKSNPESNEIIEKSNKLLEEYIKNNKNVDEDEIRFKGLYTTLLIKKLFEDGLITEDGEIDDSYIELIKASLKTDSKLLKKDDK